MKICKVNWQSPIAKSKIALMIPQNLFHFEFLNKIFYTKLNSNYFLNFDLITFKLKLIIKIEKSEKYT